MNREEDICRFKHTCKYLKEERGLDVEEVGVIAELNAVTVKKILDATKDDIPKLRASTWAKIQDFNEHYREEAGELPVVGEAEETIKSYHFKGNGKGEKEDVLIEEDVELTEEDQKWFALRQIVEAFGMKVTVDIKIE